MLAISETIEQTAARFVANLRHETAGDDRKVNSVDVDEHGQAHVRGGIFNATGGRSVVLSVAGLNARDVTRFREALREKGVTLSQEMADAVLMETRYALARGTMSAMGNATTEQQRAKARSKKAQRRQWARENGLCIICCRNPACERLDGRPGSTCRECQDKANAAKKRRP